MVEKLEQMDEHRRERLIAAAIAEFSEFPFDKASTNSIVKRAKISKGLLFHYFEDKRDLYESLGQYVIDLVMREFEEQMDWSDTDVFQRLLTVMQVKVSLAQRFPGYADFLVKLLSGGGPHLSVKNAKENYKKYGVDYEQYMGRILSENIDYSRFKDQAQIGTYLKIISSTLEGIGTELAQTMGHLDQPALIREYNERVIPFIKILKESFYKEDVNGEE